MFSNLKHNKLTILPGYVWIRKQLHFTYSILYPSNDFLRYINMFSCFLSKTIPDQIGCYSYMVKLHVIIRIFEVIFTINKLFNSDFLNFLRLFIFQENFVAIVCGNLCFSHTLTFLEIQRLLFWKGQLNPYRITQF